MTGTPSLRATGATVRMCERMYGIVRGEGVIGPEGDLDERDELIPPK